MADHILHHMLLHLHKTRYNLAAIYAVLTAAEWIIWWQLGLVDDVRAHPHWSVFIAILSVLVVFCLSCQARYRPWLKGMLDWSLDWFLAIVALSAAFQSGVWSYVRLGGWWSLGFCGALASVVFLLHTLLLRYGLTKYWLLDQLLLGTDQPVLDALATKYKVSQRAIITNALDTLSSESRTLHDMAQKILVNSPDQAVVDPLVRMLDGVDGYTCRRRLNMIRTILTKTGTVLSAEAFERVVKAFLNEPDASTLSYVVDIGGSRHRDRLISLMTKLLDYRRDRDYEFRFTAACYLTKSGDPDGIKRARSKVTLPLLGELALVIGRTLRDFDEGYEFTHTHTTWVNDYGSYSTESGTWVDRLSSIRTLTGRLNSIGDRGIIESLEQLRRAIPPTIASIRTDTFFRQKPEYTPNDMLEPIDDLIRNLQRTNE